MPKPPLVMRAHVAVAPGRAVERFDFAGEVQEVQPIETETYLTLLSLTASGFFVCHPCATIAALHMEHGTYGLHG